MEGDRTVLLCDYVSLRDFVKSTQAAGATITFQRVVNLLAEADATILDNLVKGGVKLQQVQHSKEETPFVPAGYITVERSENNCDIKGLKWSALSEQAFVQLAMSMLPDDPSKVKPNSVQALLAKVMLGIEAANKGTKRPMAIKTEMCAAVVAMRAEVEPGAKVEQVTPAESVAKRAKAS